MNKLVDIHPRYIPTKFEGNLADVFLEVENVIVDGRRRTILKAQLSDRPAELKIKNSAEEWCATIFSHARSLS